MKSLLLLIIALALTSTACAENEEYNYYCARNLEDCGNIKKGDMLEEISSGVAVVYCDKEQLILPARETGKSTHQYSCIYNGKPFKPYNPSSTRVDEGKLK